MPDTFTATLNLTKVGINESNDTWGTKLNTNCDKIDADAADTDAQILALQNRITVLETEATKASWIGEIRMHAGTIASIDTIPGGVWKLCDGANGTVDLKDRFLLSAHAGRPAGQIGGAFAYNLTTTNSGIHSHGGSTGWHALTLGQMPHHDHYVNDPGHVHDWPGLGGSILVTGGGDGSVQWSGNQGNLQYKGFSLDHRVTGIWLSGNGGNEGHPHTIGNDGDHTHAINSAPCVPPYYAMCFVQRIA